MNTLAKQSFGPLVYLGLLVAASAALPDVKAADDREIAIGELFKLTAPESWVRQEPRTRIVEHEFKVEPVEGDDEAGRVTVMGAGGGIDANIERWRAQFAATDDGQIPKADVKKRTIAGQDVHVVDISGTYLDKPGPFVPGPGIPRPNYRMLAAIIQTKKGDYFIKFYGPERTIAAGQDAFKVMLEGLSPR